MLKQERQRRGWTLRQVGERAGREWWHRGGNLYFETGSGGRPSVEDYYVLAQMFGFDPETWAHVIQGSYEGITDIDYIGRSYPEPTTDLNSAGLRSKPVGLYLDLFKPLATDASGRRALVLYGGSGNAAVAAGALGYEVTVCEADPARCKAIARHYDRQLGWWVTQAQQRNLWSELVTQAQLWRDAQ